MALDAQPTILFEEQFDEGIPDTWEIGPGSPEGAVWQWSPDGHVDSAMINGVMAPALFWGGPTPLASPTASNGAALYNSDVYDAGGIGPGEGPYPGGTSGALTTPSIDCSGETAILLSFYQYARGFLNQVPTLVEVTNDGGENWTNFPINGRVTGNRVTPQRDEHMVIDISEVAAGQPDVKIRFTWDGRFYFWIIDDIQVMTPPKYVTSMDEIFYTPASYAQPVSQIPTDTFAFIAVMSNLGSEPIPNLVFRASVQRVVGNSTVLVHQDSLVLDAFPALAKDSVLEIPQRWAPELEQGIYRLRYEVYSQNPDVNDEEFTVFNDIITSPFRVTPVLFSNEEGDIENASRPASGGDYALGNLYRMSPLAGNNFQTRELRFAVAKNESDGPLTGNLVTLLVYKVKDEVESDWSNFETTSDESVEVVGFGTYEFTSSDDNYDLILADVFDLDGNPIALEAGARYFVMASYADESNRIFHATNDELLSNIFRGVSTVLFSDGEWGLGGFGPETNAVMRMVIELSTTTDEVPLEDSAMSLFPNPSSEALNVQLDLQEAGPAMLIMADMQGQVLDIREYQNVQKETLQFDVSHLPAGTYLMRVSTDEGTKTKQFVVVK